MIKRELYLEKIRRLINTEPIKIITGVRRSGKTYLLHSIKEELIERIYKYFEEINVEPVVYHWKYNLDFQ